MVYSALDEALVSILPFFSSRNSIYSTVVKVAGRKMICWGGGYKARRGGWEKWSVWKYISKNQLDKGGEEGCALGGAWRPSLPRGFLPPPLFKRSVSWLTCTRTGQYLILKRGFDCFFACACSLHRHCLCIPEMIKQSLPPYTWEWKATDLCPIKLQIKSLAWQIVPPINWFQ